jgi:hypothetical protein
VAWQDAREFLGNQGQKDDPMVWRRLQKNFVNCATEFAGIAFALLLLCTPVTPSAAQETRTQAQPGEAATLSLGGRLYDNHWTVLGRTPPEKWHPQFPSSVKIAPTGTWRCASCHGWDYRGADGHLGQLSKDPVFKSLAGVAGKDPNRILAALEADPHREVTEPIPPRLMLALARFLSYGQQDMADLVDTQGKPIGNPLVGKDIFEGTCARCHGDRPSLGWIARNRTEQAIHKIRNGVPAADMLSLRFLDIDSLSGLLAYLQQLDPER